MKRCPNCKGLLLSPGQLAVLKVCKERKFTSSKVISVRLSCSIVSAGQRLNELARAELLTRIRYIQKSGGYEFQYSLRGK